MCQQQPILVRITIAFLFILVIVPHANGDTVSTSFEEFNTIVGEPFSIGISPITATFSGDAFAGTAGIFELYRTGLRAWMGVPNGVARIDFESPATEVVFFARTLSTANGVSVITAFDPDNNIVGLPETLVVGDPFREINFSGNIDHIVMENFATGVGQMNSIDDFSFTAFAVPITVTVEPDSLTVFRGFQIGGTLEDVFESDDSWMLFNPGFTINSTEAPVWLIFDGTLPSDSPASLEIVMESQAGTPGLTGTLEAWNWMSMAYDVFDVSATSFNKDTIVVVDLSSGISDYVQAGTGAVRTRVGWRKTGFTINFPWEVRLDQMVWIVE